MKLPVDLGNHIIDAEPYLREAFDALPFINPAHEPHFALVFQKHWNTGVIERTMMRSGLPKDFFMALGRLSHEEAIQAISVRASHNIVREGRRLDHLDLRQGPLGSRFKEIECSSDMGCRKARAMHGKVFPIEARKEFPLPDCKEMWCCCGWELVFPKRG